MRKDGMTQVSHHSFLFLSLRQISQDVQPFQWNPHIPAFPGNVTPRLMANLLHGNHQSMSSNQTIKSPCIKLPSFTQAFQSTHNSGPLTLANYKSNAFERTVPCDDIPSVDVSLRPMLATNDEETIRNKLMARRRALSEKTVEWRKEMNLPVNVGKKKDEVESTRDLIFIIIDAFMVSDGLVKGLLIEDLTEYALQLDPILLAYNERMKQAKTSVYFCNSFMVYMSNQFKELFTRSCLGFLYKPIKRSGRRKQIYRYFIKPEYATKYQTLLLAGDLDKLDDVIQEDVSRVRKEYHEVKRNKRKEKMKELLKMETVNVVKKKRGRKPKVASVKEEPSEEVNPPMKFYTKPLMNQALKSAIQQKSYFCFNPRSVSHDVDKNVP